jgi:type I restriction enzyme, S subunit
MKGPWRIVPLGDVVKPVQRPEAPLPGVTYRQLGVRLWGEGAYERESVDGMATKYATLSQVRADDIVVNKIWARNGSVAVVQEALSGCFVSGEFPTFAANSEALLPRWVHWLTKTPGFWTQCDEKSRGTSGKNRIKPEQFLRVEIPLPPLREQRRIVERIDQLAVKVNEARSLRQQSSEQTAALLPSATAQVFMQSNGNGWQPGKLGDYVLDDCYGTSEKANDDETGVPVLRMGNIQNGRIDFRSLKYLHLSKRDRQRLLLKVGDILVNRTNSAELVGKCAVFELPGEYSFASYLIRLRLDDTRADPRAVAAYINSPIGRSYMLAEKR